MASNHARMPAGDFNSPAPLLVPLFAGAGTAVLFFTVGVLVWAIAFPAEAPPLPPVVQGPESQPPVPPPGVEPVVTPPLPPAVPKADAWWDSVPDGKIARTVAGLRLLLPQEQALFDALGDKADAARLVAYRQLTAKLPTLVRGRHAKDLLAPFLTDCYVAESADANAACLCDWLVAQVPRENAEFPADFAAEDLDRSFWALDVSLDAMTQPAIRFDRLKRLSEELGKALGVPIDPGTPRPQLKGQTEKLLALRCYRNLAPTAAKSAAHALALRGTLAGRLAPYLSPASRENLDLGIVFAGLPTAKTTWNTYSALLRDCLASKNPDVALGVADLYAQADGEMAAALEPLLSGKWAAVKDRNLSHTAKVKAIRKSLGIPDPADRVVQLEKLGRAALAGTDAPANKNRALLQDAARLAHASTLACALLQKDAGAATFDAWVAKVPDIEPPEPPAAKTKGDPKAVTGGPKGPASDVKGPAKGAAIVPTVTPRFITGTLRANGALDPLRPGCVCDVYPLSLKRGRSYSIHMISSFDNYLRLETAAGASIAEDDDSGGGLNALIRFTAPADGVYRLVATSCAGGLGPYRLSIQEGAAFVGPGFGGPLPFGRRFKFMPPPGLFPPGLMPGMMPGIGPDGPPQLPGADPSPAADVGDSTPHANPKDIANLDDKKPSKTRLSAFLNIAESMKGDLAQYDLKPSQARAVAGYLLTVKNRAELDEAAAKLPPFGKSRNLLLALADRLEQSGGDQKVGEAVVGAVTGHSVHFDADGWNLACRRRLLQEVLSAPGKEKNAATETADVLRSLYREQAVLLAIPARDLEAARGPAQVLERLIKHVADRLGKQSPSAETRAVLEQVPRQLLAAGFVARNDLEELVQLQRVWLRVLALYLETEMPQRAREIRQVVDGQAEVDRGAANVLEQLRAGEERILRAWMLANETK